MSASPRSADPNDPTSFGRSLDEARGRFSPAELSLFSELLERVESLYDERLESVKLVGSRARGTAMDRSDYDFLLFLDRCDYDVEVPRLEEVAYRLSLEHGLGSISLSPMSREQFLALDTKYEGITDSFRRDAVDLWPRPA